MNIAKYYGVFDGRRYYRDIHGNLYTEISGEVAFCSVMKRGPITEDKAEPNFPVKDTILVD